MRIFSMWGDLDEILHDLAKNMNFLVIKIPDSSNSENIQPQV